MSTPLDFVAPTESSVGDHSSVEALRALLEGVVVDDNDRIPDDITF